MSPYRIGRLSLALSLWCVTAVAVTPDDLSEVRRQFSSGVNSEANNEAVHDRLYNLLQHDPDNPLLLVYYGSTETVMGKYAWMPWNKLDYVNNGLGHIEQALRLAEQRSDSSLFEVQLVAASTYVALPDRFNTLESGRKLLQRLLAAESEHNWSGNFRRSLYAAAVKAAERENDREAQAKWQARVDALSTVSTPGVQ